MSDEEKPEILSHYETKWIEYRIKTLDIISAKLSEMKFIAEIAKDIDIEDGQKMKLNERLNELKEEINALDEESRLRLDEEN